jgi:hypothetical protein
MRFYGKRSGPEIIIAQEIASFVYCPEAWRLQYGFGLEPTNQESLNAGRRHHARKTIAERIAGLGIAVGRSLIVVSLVLLLLLWLVWR